MAYLHNAYFIKVKCYTSINILSYAYNNSIISNKFHKHMTEVPLNIDKIRMSHQM
jgi:hypothetical protein